MVVSCPVPFSFDSLFFRRLILSPQTFFRAMANLHADFKITLTDNGIPDDQPHSRIP